LFSLHEQIDHKVDFIEQELQHSEQSIVLVGHSIGAYIGLEVFKRLQNKVSILAHVWHSFLQTIHTVYYLLSSLLLDR